MGGSAKAKTKEALIRTAVWYFEHWKSDPATTLILENGHPAVEVSFNFDFLRQPYILCGHLDKIVRFQDALFVMDHKTTTHDPTGWFYDRYNPDNQMSMYVVAGQITIHSPIRGVIIDAIKVDEGGAPEFGRGFTYRNPDQLEEWFGDLNDLIERAERYAEANYWPMNDTACGMYGGCQFRSVCSKSPSVRQAYLEADFVQRPEDERWNPLTPRISTIPSQDERSGSGTQELEPAS